MFKLFFLIFTILASISVYADKPFNLEAFHQSQKLDEKILLHFHADWCPTCKLQKNVLKKLDADGFTKGITVYTVDYDQETDFKKEMKINHQSSFVAFYGAAETGRADSITQESDIKNFLSDKLVKLTLSDRLDLIKAGMAGHVPPEKVKMMTTALENLKKTQIEKKALSVGKNFPDFSLNNYDGKKVQLKELLKKGPVIVSFYRGSWCPFCNAQLNAFQQHIGQFRELGASLVTITPEKPDLAALTASDKKLDFPVLTDKNNKLAQKLGLVFGLTGEYKELYKQFGVDLEKSQENGDWKLPMPATYVVSPKGKVIYAFIDADYTKRATPEEIIAALKSLK